MSPKVKSRRAGLMPFPDTLTSSLISVSAKPGESPGPSVDWAGTATVSLLVLFDPGDESSEELFAFVQLLQVRAKVYTHELLDSGAQLLSRLLETLEEAIQRPAGRHAGCHLGGC